jgi:chaperonin GroES
MTQCNIRPCNDRVVVKPFPMETMTEGGLFIPDNYDPGFDKGRVTAVVIAVGPGKRGRKGGREPLEIKAGQIVHYQKVVEIPIPNTDTVLIQEADILYI